VLAGHGSATFFHDTFTCSVDRARQDQPFRFPARFRSSYSRPRLFSNRASNSPAALLPRNGTRHWVTTRHAGPVGENARRATGRSRSGADSRERANFSRRRWVKDGIYVLSPVAPPYPPARAEDGAR